MQNERQIESGATQAGKTEIIVRTAGGRLARTGSDVALLMRSLREASSDPLLPSITPQTVEDRLARLALSDEQKEELEAIESILGERVSLPGTQESPLIVQARERLRRYQDELERAKLRERRSLIERGRGTNTRLGRFRRWLDRVLAPEGSEAIRSQFRD